MDKNLHWLIRPATIRRLWWLLYAVLLITVLLQLFIKPYGHFKIASTFAFSAWFGLVACVLMVLFAKLLGFLIKRKDDYYDD